MKRSIILEKATDWTGQTYEQRLTMAAELLFTQSYLSRTVWQRLDRHIRDNATAARRIRAREKGQ